MGCTVQHPQMHEQPTTGIGCISKTDPSKDRRGRENLPQFMECFHITEFQKYYTFNEVSIELKYRDEKGTTIRKAII